MWASSSAAHKTKESEEYKSMKKAIISFMCLVLGIPFLSGCGETASFEQKSYSSGQETLSGLILDVRDRAIEIVPSEDGLVHIDYYVSDEEFYEFRLSEEGVLTMSSAVSKSWTDYVGTKAGAEYRKLCLRLPEGALTSLSISTTNEDITLSSLRVLESLSLSVNGGNISFEKLDAGKLIELNAKNGGISGTIAGGYDDFAISCQVKKGKSNLPDSKDGGEKQLNISCNNGDVNIALEP